MLWRPYHGNIERVDQFFAKQNLWALSLLLNCLSQQKKSVKDTLLFAFQSSVLNASIMYRYRKSGKGGIAMGTYYVPSVFQSMNAFAGFQNKIADVLLGLKELADIDSTSLLISTQSAVELCEITGASVDFIFTDPPYSWKVQYGESNFLWEAWLKFDSNWLKDEVIINYDRDIDESLWTERIMNALKECFRVLKPGRWLSLCYHDTSEGTWELIQDIACEIGFIPDRTDQTIFIDATQRSWKQNVAEKVTKRDLVINFRKPRPGEAASEKTIITGEEDERTFAEKARLILVDALETRPGSTSDRLYDDLVSRMVRRGEFERHNFDELLRSVAEPVREPVMQNLFEAKSPDLFGTHETVRWYLKGISGSLDEAEGKKEAAAANRLERFMVERRKDRGEPGVHYSDLFEQYLPIVDKPRRRLIEWLPEYFFKTEEGTWRPPEDDEEREQKAALRSSGTLRRIKRFTNALLQGVPPYHKDQPENTATLVDWIRQCRRAGLYEQGRVLFEKGGLRFDQLNEYAQLEVEEDYQICIRRSEKKPAAPKKTKQETLFEADE